MARILVVSFFPANLPPRSGGEVRLFALYEALSAHHDVTLLSSGELRGRIMRLQHSKNFREVRVPKSEEYAVTWSKLHPHAGSGDLSGPCLASAATIPSELHEVFLDLYSKSDIIIHDSPFAIDYDIFMGFDGKPRIYNSYNVEFDLYEKIHSDAKDRVIVDIVKDCESRMVRGCDFLTACTQEDYDRFAALYQLPTRAMIVPNGVNQFSAPLIERKGNKLVFIGSSHYPNQTAAMIIKDVIAPAFPEYEFHIIGSCHEKGRFGRNCVAHGVVDDAAKRRLLSGALACINPMIEGGGSSLKIPDVASYGTPLISTELGARGFSLEARVHYSPIDVDDIIGSVGSALSDPARLMAQATKAAEHFSKNYTWAVIADRFSQNIDDVLREAKAKSSQPRMIVLNDYDPFSSIGGGATRIRGLYEGASERVLPIILTFSDTKKIKRQEVFEGKGLAISIPKSAEHHKRESAQADEFFVSTVDFLAMEFAPQNSLLTAAFNASECFADIVSCEHPYMASLLESSDRRFIYSSQNNEVALKKQLLAHHPRYGELVEKLGRIESFCVGCSELVVAVSDADAESFSAENDLVAPVVVIRNGADELLPLDGPDPTLPGFNACFLGSGHIPNYNAAKFLIEKLAPALPGVTFHIAGSVCDSFSSAPSNVRLHGRIDETAKSRLLRGCQLALNPMAEGSGSNVKVADYLQHGLPVLSTEFGARGYEGLDKSDLQLTSLDDFTDAISSIALNQNKHDERPDRRDRFKTAYSMKTFGKIFGDVVCDIFMPRKRVLYVTYRYNSPPRGGGEYYVNRLVSLLADSGMSVDVLTPRVDHIADDGRFASSFPIEGRYYPVPWGNPRIRVAKFDTLPVPNRTQELERVWQEQPSFERELFRQFHDLSDGPGLLWGWADYDGGGRWTMDRFALLSQNTGTWLLKGSANPERYILARSAEGEVLLESSLSGRFEIRFEAPAGTVEVSVYNTTDDRIEDPRPLGIYLKEVAHNSISLIEDAPLNLSADSQESVILFHAIHKAAKRTRFDTDVSLSKLRGPYAPDLERYLFNHVEDYDLVVTHNVVFRTATKAIDAANRSNVPSVLIPHAHFEDDYYHFPDVFSALSKTNLALVTPLSACDFLGDLGLNNINYLAPGIDGNEQFSNSDEESFASLYKSEDPFVLVVGRKAAAKGYRDVIGAVSHLREGPWPNLRVVMVGPDDDHVAIEEDFVDYLGMVDRSVLRGAYRASALLATMSTSESFGMVILEAGLASRPVVANSGCASFAQLVKNGQNGYLATKEDLSDRIADILRDPSKAEKMGQIGRKMALMYDWDKIGAAFVKHCNDVISSAKGRNR